MVKVVNNFMHRNDFNHLRQEVLKANFFYNSSVSEDYSKDGYYFAHMIYQNNEKTSTLFHLIEPILDKIDAKQIYRAKVNLFPGGEKLKEYGQHQDTMFKCKVFLLSLNTCDGFTRIGKTTKIPKELSNMTEDEKLNYHLNKIKNLGTEKTDKIVTNHFIEENYNFFIKYCNDSKLNNLKIEFDEKLESIIKDNTNNSKELKLF